MLIEKCKTRVSLAGTAAVLIVSIITLAGCNRFDEAATLAGAKKSAAAGDLPAAAIQYKSVLQHAPANLDARIGLGQVLLQSGDVEGAALELARAAEAGGRPSVVAPLLAQAYVEVGNFKRVVQNFADTKIDDGDAQVAVWVEVARAWVALGDLVKAQAVIDRALKLRPDAHAVLLMQARLSASRGELEQAAAIVDKAIASNASNPESWYLKGELLRFLRQYPQALAAQRKALELKPGYVRSHVAVIGLLMRSGDKAGVASQLAALEKAAPAHPVTALMLGEAALERRDYARARELSQALLRGLPDQPGVLMLAGAVEAAAGSLAQSAAHYGKVVGQNPEFVDARENLAAVQMRTGQLQQALLTLRPVLSSKEPTLRTLQLAGDIHVRQGNFLEAEKLFSRAAKLAPEEVAIRVSALSARLLGSGASDVISQLRQIADSSQGIDAEKVLFASYLRRQDYAAAMSVVDSMARKKLDAPVLSELRGVVQLARGDTQAAKSHYLESYKADPARVGSLAKVVSIEVGEGNLTGAQARIASALAAEPKNSALLLLMAEVRERSGAPVDEIRKLLADAVQAAPLSIEARSRQIRYSLQRRLNKDALGQAQDALAALPTETAMLELVAETQFLAGEVEQASLTFRRLVSALPDAAEPYVKLAQVYRSLGKSDQAEQSLRRALELEPENPIAVSQLVELLAATNRRAAALEFLKVQRSARASRPETYLVESALHERLGDPAAAINALRDGLVRVPSTALASRLYRLLVARGNEKEASQFAETWLKQRPEDTRMQFDVAMRHAELRRWDVSEPLLRKVVAANPNNALALNALAYTIAERGGSGALEFAKRANEVAPNTPAYMDTLASVLGRDGNLKDALEIQKRALALDPGNPHVQLGMAKLAFASGDKSTAREHLDKLQRLGDKFVRQDEVKALAAKL